MFKKAVRAYWWRGRPNFGDGLAPLLLERFADTKVEWDTISRSSIASIGSILEHIPPLWDGFVLGSGKLIENSRLHLHAHVAKILSIRGPLSARGIPGSFTLGDPGLLANELVGPQEKIWDLGIVPHWKDNDLVGRFTKLIPSKYSIKVIKPEDDPLDVVKQIGQCRRIVTSSLHGMIVADSFGGTPRRVELCPALDKEGGDFKFRDYSASIKAAFIPGKMFEPSRSRVDDVKFAVYDAYQFLSEELNANR